MINGSESAGWHSQFLPYLVNLQCSFKGPLRWFFCLFTLANRQNNNEILMWRQMIKVFARPTNNAEQFCGQLKEGKFKCKHLTKFFVRLHEIFGFHEFNLSSFVICFNVVELILF